MAFNPFQRRTISSSSVFSLTTLGKEKAEQFGSDTKSRILCALEELGPSQVKEICQETHVTRGKVEGFLRVLVRSGHIHSVRGEE